MEKFGILCIHYDHLVYFTAIWSILRPLGIFYGYLVYIFFRVLVCSTPKNLATSFATTSVGILAVYITTTYIGQVVISIPAKRRRSEKNVFASFHFFRVHAAERVITILTFRRQRERTKKFRNFCRIKMRIKNGLLKAAEMGFQEWCLDHLCIVTRGFTCVHLCMLSY
jgi:hypothetical protein